MNLAIRVYIDYAPTPGSEIGTQLTVVTCVFVDRLVLYLVHGNVSTGILVTCTCQLPIKSGRFYSYPPNNVTMIYTRKNCRVFFLFCFVWCNCGSKKSTVAPWKKVVTKTLKTYFHYVRIEALSNENSKPEARMLCDKSGKLG